MRHRIQYDLDEPPTAPSVSLPTEPHDALRPPTKKRKRNHHNAQKPFSGPCQKAKMSLPIQHWDDPGSSAVGMVYDEEGSASMADASVAMSYEEEEGHDDEAADGGEGIDADAAVDVEQEEQWEEEEENRPLTQEEIWDDSVLIDAWNSAEAEYEAYHGTSKSWKTEPVKRSPLWYKKPYTVPPPKPRASKPKPRPPHAQAQAHAGNDDSEPEPDTAPLDFDTYIPTHDPSLASAGPTAPPTTTATAATTPFFVPPLSTTTVSRDEAFNNALSAMYWSGYWTAVYHCQSQSQTSGPIGAMEEDRNGADEVSDGDEEVQDLVPAQR